MVDWQLHSLTNACSKLGPTTDPLYDQRNVQDTNTEWWLLWDGIETTYGWFAWLLWWQLQNWRMGDASCFLHWTMCFLQQQWWAASLFCCLHPMMPCGWRWYFGDLSMVQAEWMAIHGTSGASAVWLGLGIFPLTVSLQSVFLWISSQLGWRVNWGVKHLCSQLRRSSCSLVVCLSLYQDNADISIQRCRLAIAEMTSLAQDGDPVVTTTHAPCWKVSGLARSYS